MDAKEIVEKYLTAWQKGDKETLLSLFSEKGEFGVKGESSREAVSNILEYPAWKDVRVISNVADEDGNAAILYEGTDPETGRTLRASDFLTVRDGQILGHQGMVVGGTLFTDISSTRSIIHTDAI